MDDLTFVGVGLEPLEVEFLVATFVGGASTAHGSMLCSDLRGWKGNELASKLFYE